MQQAAVGQETQPSQLLQQQLLPCSFRALARTPLLVRPLLLLTLMLPRLQDQQPPVAAQQLVQLCSFLWPSLQQQQRALQLQLMLAVLSRCMRVA
jgi:hypothetical protein